MNWKKIGDVAKASGRAAYNYLSKGGAQTKTLYQKAKEKGVPWGIRSATVMGLALPTRIAVKTGKAVFRGTGIVLGQAAKRPMLSTAIGITGAGMVGGIRGGYRAWRNQEPMRDMNSPAQPQVGPGYSTWSKPRGMGANNLGATGSLSLGLHKMRHR
jgi:hypothetical protein